MKEHNHKDQQDKNLQRDNKRLSPSKRLADLPAKSIQEEIRLLEHQKSIDWQTQRINRAKTQKVY